MPVPPQIMTGGLIVATTVTAAGLNLGVIGLNREATAAPVAVAEEAAALSAPSADEVELTSLAGVSAAPAHVVLSVKTDDEEVAPASASAVLGSTAAEAHESDHDERDDHGDDDSDHDDDEHDDDSDRDDDEHDDDDDHDGEGHDSNTSTSETSTTLAQSASPSTTAVQPQQSTTSQQQSASTTAPAAAPIEYLTYEFEGIASIIVALYADRSLEFWSATPEAGWAFLVEDEGPRQVKLKFRPKAGGEEAEFGLKFEDGRLKVKREY